ncbi:hypothetical protein KQX54_017976 [Cotesia glomerata]|uniref:OCIA domain-containing protein n=1 Tax=Cotesia glomerata TaxID=32391 RepID=A0AAV7HZ65_COTGL|nr:hypothetical protein KQX54_017976 [Cotesia glomerata]
MMDPDPYKNNPTQNYPVQTFPRPDSDEVLQRQIGDALNLQLTTEEMAVLKECQHNAVFHRGLPLAAVATGGFHYMMKTGMMKKNVYTLVVSGITGFFIGTASYRSVCMEKLIALPNSTLKERILAAQGVQPVKVDLQSDSQLQPWVDVQPNWETPKAPMGSAQDIEPYQSHNDSYSSTNNTPDPVIMAYNVDMFVTRDVWFPYETQELQVGTDFYESGIKIYEFKEDPRIWIRLKSEIHIVHGMEFILISISNQRFI